MRGNYDRIFRWWCLFYVIYWVLCLFVSSTKLSVPLIMPRKLYMEERIAKVRQKLNEETVPFMVNMAQEDAIKFKQFIYDCLNILDGFKKEG